MSLPSLRCHLCRSCKISWPDATGEPTTLAVINIATVMTLLHDHQLLDLVYTKLCEAAKAHNQLLCFAARSQRALIADSLIAEDPLLATQSQHGKSLQFLPHSRCQHCSQPRPSIFHLTETEKLKNALLGTS